MEGHPFTSDSSKTGMLWQPQTSIDEPIACFKTSGRPFVHIWQAAVMESNEVYNSEKRN